MNQSKTLMLTDRLVHRSTHWPLAVATSIPSCPTFAWSAQSSTRTSTSRHHERRSCLPFLDNFLITISQTQQHSPFRTVALLRWTQRGEKIRLIQGRATIFVREPHWAFICVSRAKIKTNVLFQS
jgi:hypothetical protein